MPGKFSELVAIMIRSVLFIPVFSVPIAVSGYSKYSINKLLNGECETWDNPLTFWPC